MHLHRYPSREEESWWRVVGDRKIADAHQCHIPVIATPSFNLWLVVGDAKANTLLAIKRVKLGAAWRGRLEFTAPEAAGAAKLTLYFMCDSYMGADQVGCRGLCLHNASHQPRDQLGVRTCLVALTLRWGHAECLCRSPLHLHRPQA